MFANLLTNNILYSDELEFLRTFYSKTVLIVGNQKVEISKGVMQGSITSLALFNIFIQPILKLLNREFNIEEALDKKYATEIDYMAVYTQVRKNYPRFGINDTNSFLQFLRVNNIYHTFQISDSDQSLCKIFFKTKLMQANYDKYGEICIIDSTYRINIYSAPLLIISGINNKGRNVMFAITIINNERKDTFD